MMCVWGGVLCREFLLNVNSNLFPCWEGGIEGVHLSHAWRALVGPVIKLQSCSLQLLDTKNRDILVIVQPCLTLHNTMDSSTSGFPVPHPLPKFAQVHVYCVSDAIQPSHLLMPLLLLPSIFPSINGFSNELALHIKWSKYWSFNFSTSPSSEWVFRVDFPQGWLVWSLVCARKAQDSFLASQLEGISCLAFCLLYSPALTTLRDHQQDHRPD